MADQILFVSTGHKTVSNTIIEQLKELFVHLAKKAVAVVTNMQNGT